MWSSITCSENSTSLGGEHLKLLCAESEVSRGQLLGEQAEAPGEGSSKSQSSGSTNCMSVSVFHLSIHLRLGKIEGRRRRE